MKKAGPWHCVFSFAKVNLGLEVLGPRGDGYHELRTLFQTIDLRDEIRLRLIPGGAVRLSCAHPLVPQDDTNLAARAARELQRFAGRSEGVEIVLQKNIPVAGGLGGGSSNAAATLMALDRIWRLDLGIAGLQPLACRLGADVPYFLVGGTALGLARGDEVYPLWKQVRGHVVVVDLERPVSTAEVFRRIAAQLTARENSNTIFRFVLRDLAGDGSALRTLVNDLEEAALEQAPELKDRVASARSILIHEGASLAALSGSGASFFGLFADSGRARRAHAALASEGFRAVTAKTLTLDQYRRRWSGTLGKTWRTATDP
jgi:4-diphosphocytidyl-2-C-methyl-D-erythritol kinase